LATLEFGRGTIRERDKVYIDDGPLPACAQVRAVEHERERTAALVIRERKQWAFQAPGTNGTENLGPTPRDADSPKPLPTLLENRPPVPEMEKP